MFAPIRRALAPFVCFALLIALLALPVAAQLDGGQYQLTQHGVLVGQIYVPERSPDDCEYREYWYLHKDYIYPSQANGQGFNLQPEEGAMAQSVEAFLAAVEESHPGGRLVVVDSTEIREGC